MSDPNISGITPASYYTSGNTSISSTNAEGNTLSSRTSYASGFGPTASGNASNTGGKAIIGNTDSKIEKAVELIVDSIEYGIAYGRYICFRNKVNGLYNQLLSADPDISVKKITKRTIEDTSKVVIRAAFRVWRERLQESQVFYAQCLRDLQAKGQFEDVGQNASVPTEQLDPPVGDSGPFDRRLDRLMLTDQANGAQVVIPYDTRFNDAGTLGFNMSEQMVRDSEIPNNDEIAMGIAATNEAMRNDPFFIGVQSIVNSYSITKLYGSNSGEYLIDKKGERRWYEIDSTQDGKLAYSLNPTTTSIINWGEGDPYGRTPYHFSDFVFCKHWNIIPNNRMLTLRRYPAPIVDNLKFPGMDGFSGAGTPSDKSDDGWSNNDPDNIDDTGIGTSYQGEKGTEIIGEDQGSGKKVEFPPMASAVTYFGEETNNQLSDILKFTTGFNWGETEANVFEVGTTSNPDMEAGPAGLFGGLGSMAKMLNIGSGNFDSNAIMNEGNLPPDPYNDGPYENRIIGPVNAITSVRKRERGLQYENKISLTFEYVARPIGGVNTKAVLLDIISNFLVIGSATAMFWGGQHRFMGQPQRYPFIGGDKGIQQWYRGDPLGWGQTSIDSFSTKVVGAGGVLDMAKNFFSSLLGGDGSKDIMGRAKDVMAGDNIASNIIKARAAERSKGAIPYLTGLRALLIGEPVGEWHLTIGNPLNPIAMIGNLICDNIEVEFGNELGPDDFPLDVKITVNLEHGMARDRDAIQSMFNRGMGRIYDLPDAMAGSADTETRVDNQTGNQSKTGRSPSDWRGGAVIGGAATSGGKTGPSRVRENALQGNTSVWNQAKFNSISPNQFAEFGTRNNPQNIWARSEFRATSWVGLKSLK